MVENVEQAWKLLELDDKYGLEFTEEIASLNSENFQFKNIQSDNHLSNMAYRYKEWRDRATCETKNWKKQSHFAND